MPALGDEDIRRLDVAMHDSFGMSGIERVGNLDGQRKNELRLQRAARDAVLQSQPIQKLHHDERAAIFLPDLVDRTDVGVVQS